MLTENKKQLSERDICSKFVTPAVVQAGWDAMAQVREEVFFTKGRIIVRGKLVTRGKAKRADYILYYKPNFPLALIEVKDNNHSVGDGMQQALEYAKTLNIPFVFSSNGDGFVFHDRTCDTGAIETNLALDAFPSPQELWARYRAWKGLSSEEEKIVLQDYYDDGSGRTPRYYQANAVNSAVEAIAKGQDRILLVMATGTGKTYTAFQIIWRLWKAGRKKRILFLADRNVLVDQTMVNDFRPFGKVMAKLSTNAKTIERPDGSEVELTTALDKRRRIDSSYEVYLGLYQAITGPEERQKLFREFSPGFFDLIVIDECHRGSAAADSAWREILAYFSAATQIGLTATPRETEYVSNIHYFGEPVYYYSLKQGIQDGFLAPYKVVKVHIDRDVEGYRPEKGTLDREGDEVEDRIYNQKDFDRVLVLDERTRLVARKVTEFLKESGDRFQKTIVFCVDEEHAARMRQALINENADLVAENARYVMRITGSDDEGQAQLGNFIDPESKYPVLVTTSRLLSTGVDAQTCRLIVLDRPVGSMTEFKQIVGRGTRVHEDTKKFYFTLIDFRGATSHFADPAFDGEPVQIYEPGEEDPIVPPEAPPVTDDDAAPIPPEPDVDEVIVDGQPPDISIAPEGPRKREKVYVDGVSATIIAERVEYLDDSGKLVTESLRDFTKKALMQRFASLDVFLNRWKSADRKQAVIEELAAEGLPLEPLAEEVGKDLDPFDLICHIAFDRAPLTRRELADNVRKRDIFTKYGPQARAVLEALLQKYQDEGILGLDARILQIAPFDAMGTPLQLIKEFGTRAEFEQAVHELQAALYQEAVQSPMSVRNLVKSIQDIMRQDVGVDGDAQRISQLCWMFFLKIIDDQDQELELLDSGYRSPLPKKLQWRTWAADPEGITGDALMAFVNEDLFPSLKELPVGGKQGDRRRVVRDVFEDAYNYMKSGQLMRQVINKIQQVDFNNLAERQHFGDIYEQILNDLQSAGNAGEYYTPRAVTAFMADRIDPHPGEILLDPACGTGGFLTCALRHMRERYVKKVEDEQQMQAALRAVEKKQLPHMLCVTNMLLHGIKDPSFVRHDNTLARPYISYGQTDRVDIVLTNPPFGGREEDGIESNFPKHFQTRETADLFLALIIRLLKPTGRAAVVLPDGSLFGEGVKTRLKEHLMEECNLHTIVRLPNSVFKPYASIGTNLLFFEKGEPTREIWFYEHRVPDGQKAYSMTKPIRLDHFKPCVKWWGGAKRKGRKESEVAWKVSADEVKARGYNLDFKNPHTVEDDHGDPEELLVRLDEAEKEAASLRDQFKGILAEALLR